MKGTILAVLAIVVAFFVGFAVGNGLEKKDAAMQDDAAAKGELTQSQKSVLVDQMALAIQANSEEIAKKILADAQNKATAENALKIVAEKAKSCRTDAGGQAGPGPARGRSQQAV